MQKINIIGQFVVIFLVVSGSMTGFAWAEEQDDAELVLTLEEGQSPPPASIASAAWMAGNWSGDDLGGMAEESYLPPAGGAMIGMFRQLKDGKPVFYEFVAITEHEGSLLFQIKHFNPDMHGWEKQDESTEFRLVRVTDDALYFDGLTYMKTGKDTMSAYVRLGSEDGNNTVAGFSYHRVEEN